MQLIIRRCSPCDGTNYLLDNLRDHVCKETNMSAVGKKLVLFWLVPSSGPALRLVPLELFSAVPHNTKRLWEE